jgi:hypothetical protein
MISHLLGTELDQKARAPDQQPGYQVLLYSRWQDTDSDIVRGLAHQTPIDLTERVVQASLNLDMNDDASSLNLTLSVEGLNLNIFSNCVVTVQEGDARVDPSDWPYTFTGWRIGQPGSSESAAAGIPAPEAGRGPRGAERTIELQFQSREKLFTEYEITSDGVWLPNAVAQTEHFQYRNDFDNVGSIAREVATNTEWGMGLTNDEVAIAKLPYRIEKQLQFVQVSAWEALQTLLQVVHAVPGVNGEGRVVLRSRRLDTPAVRTYNRNEIISISQPDAVFTAINSVTARGLAKDLTEVAKKDQRLLSIQGTFGFFAPEITYKNSWGADQQDSYQVKVGTVVDGDGKTVQSPRIRRFRSQGFINTVENPEFTDVDELRYELRVRNNTAAVIGLLAALAAGYTAAQITVITQTPTTTTAGQPTVLNPIALGAQIAASGLLLAGIAVLQQIGNFEFEVWGVPFENVYEEIRVDAILGHFGTRLGNAPFREHERETEEIQNYILSTEDDSVVPATAHEPEITNQGVRSFARTELAIRLAEQAPRQIEMLRDILLEPGDTVEDAETGERYYIRSISRTLERGNPSTQSCEAFLLPELP